MIPIVGHKRLPRDAGALIGRTPFAPAFARDAWQLDASVTCRPRSVEVACEDLLAGTLLIPRARRARSSRLPAALAHSDRTASGRAPARSDARLDLPGVTDSRDADSGAIETASSETDCTRASASGDAEIGSVRPRDAAQSRRTRCGFPRSSRRPRRAIQVAPLLLAAPGLTAIGWSSSSRRARIAHDRSASTTACDARCRLRASVASRARRPASDANFARNGSFSHASSTM